MAQPTIYADIDCDGQVEVKVNNDTGYDCTIITSTGINETISSTATDVYRNYNLTSADWVKVVAAQDVTIAANKLTGTIKYITSVTTTTAAPTTTTTTTTPAGGGALPGNSDACTPTTWPAYGSSNTYTFTASSSGQYWQVDNQSRTIYITDAGSTSLRIIRFTDDDCLTPVNSSYTTWPAGVAVSTGGSGVGTNNTIFGIKVTAGGSVTYTIYIA